MVHDKDCYKIPQDLDGTVMSEVFVLGSGLEEASLALDSGEVRAGADLRATIQAGSIARVVAPHLGDTLERDAAGTASARDVLRELLDGAHDFDPIAKGLVAGHGAVAQRPSPGGLRGHPDHLTSLSRDLVQRMLVRGPAVVAPVSENDHGGGQPSDGAPALHCGFLSRWAL
jgi:hypothetical protein